MDTLLGHFKEIWSATLLPTKRRHDEKNICHAQACLPWRTERHEGRNVDAGLGHRDEYGALAVRKPGASMRWRIHCASRGEALMGAFDPIDAYLSTLGSGWVFVLVIAVVLGLRHATDPDHLTAVLSLRLKDNQRSPYRLGLAWGLGHSVTMIAVGIPLILFVDHLPMALQQGLEVAVGVLIIVLAIRVLWGLVKLRVHAHEHTHHEVVVHDHAHVQSSPPHVHGTRTLRSSFSIGLLHGAAGSASIVALLLTRLENSTLACLSLVIIAAFCTVSMVTCSWALCRLLDGSERRVDQRWVAGIGGSFALCFGVVYAVMAAGLVA